MLLAVDVHYRGDGGAVAAGVFFADWTSGTIRQTLIRRIAGVLPYRPGRFFERELPCILRVLDGLTQMPEAIVVDGYVVLGDGREGLGAHLFRTLGGAVPVVGVAKNRFPGTASEAEIHRGGSRRPLYVTSIGLDPEAARRCVRSMHGAHRIPTVLAAADRACRDA